MAEGELTYCVDRLTQLGTDLLTIVDVMNGASPAVQYDADEVGHPFVHDALQEFSRTWNDRREVLTREVEAVGNMALNSAEVFAEADSTLAREIAAVFRAGT